MGITDDDSWSGTNKALLKENNKLQAENKKLKEMQIVMKTKGKCKLVLEDYFKLESDNKKLKVLACKLFCRLETHTKKEAVTEIDKALKDKR